MRETRGKNYTRQFGFEGRESVEDGTEKKCRRDAEGGGDCPHIKKTEKFFSRGFGVRPHGDQRARRENEHTGTTICLVAKKRSLRRPLRKEGGGRSVSEQPPYTGEKNGRKDMGGCWRIDQPGDERDSHFILKRAEGGDDAPKRGSSGAQAR